MMEARRAALALFVVGEMSEIRGLLFTQRKTIILVLGVTLLFFGLFARGVLCCFLRVVVVVVRVLLLLACVLLCCSLIRCPRRCWAWFLLTCKQASTSCLEREGKGLVVCSC